LFLKLLLLLVGISSVISTAYCRFPPDDDDVAGLSDEMLERYRTAYVISILVQLAVLLVWMYLILVSAMETGRQLRTEPFLSTRPAQLAYRILFAHMSLGFTALAASFFFNLSQVLTKWSLNNPESDSVHHLVAYQEDLSHTETMIRVLSEVARQFPYSGTAASVGSGRILFATVSILITAFIFLPAHILEEEDDYLLEKKGAIQENKIYEQRRLRRDKRLAVQESKIHEQRRLRRDKRLVVHLAKESKTWRVFPIPIQQRSSIISMLQDDSFQLYRDMHREDGNAHGRGVVSKGPYTPLFCLELACWLNEASWQAYYSPAGISPSKRGAPGGMNLEGLGLRLEGAVFDEVTDTQVYVATNIAPQVDGEEDSIIVISFRGTNSASNLQTDFRSRQVSAEFVSSYFGSISFLEVSRVLRFKSSIDSSPGPGGRDRRRAILYIP
jgi:hypothetical protein